MRNEVRLLSVKARNYRSWCELELSYTESGVCVVKGRDLGTGTSSGVGKSSFLTLPAFALGYGPATTVAQAWGASSCSVELNFRCGEQIWTVARGSERVRLTGGDKPLHGREAEERLRWLLGAPDTLRAITWRPQASAGSFMTKTPAERREFLARVMDLGTIDKEADAAARTAKATSAEYEKLGAALKGVIDPPTPEATPPGMQAQLEELRKRLEALGAELPQLEAADRGRATLVEGLRREVRGLQEQLDGVQRESTSLLRGALLASGTCPTCGVATPVDQQQVADALAQLERLQSRALVCKNQIDSARAQIQQLEVVQIPLGARRSEWRDVERSYSQLRDQRQKRALFEAQYSAKLEAAQARRVELQEALNRSLSSTAAEADLSRFLREWQANYSAELLADLSSTTNTILAQIPNVAQVTVQFMPAPSAGGKLDVASKTYFGGVERDDGLSGGQRMAVDLAVDLATDDVVIGRSALVPRWKVLDEPFGGMGTPDREAFVQLLQERAASRKMIYLVVDQHSREFSELFEAEGIGVEMSAGVSRIVTAEERRSW